MSAPGIFENDFRIDTEETGIQAPGLLVDTGLKFDPSMTCFTLMETANGPAASYTSVFYAPLTPRLNAGYIQEPIARLELPDLPQPSKPREKSTFAKELQLKNDEISDQLEKARQYLQGEDLPRNPLKAEKIVKQLLAEGISNEELSNQAEQLQQDINKAINKVLNRLFFSGKSNGQIHHKLLEFGFFDGKPEKRKESFKAIFTSRVDYQIKQQSALTPRP